MNWIEYFVELNLAAAINKVKWTLQNKCILQAIRIKDRQVVVVVVVVVGRASGRSGLQTDRQSGMMQADRTAGPENKIHPDTSYRIGTIHDHRILPLPPKLLY